MQVLIAISYGVQYMRNINSHNVFRNIDINRPCLTRQIRVPKNLMFYDQSVIPMETVPRNFLKLVSEVLKCV